MFIFNIKLNLKLISKVLIVLFALIIVVICILSVYKIFSGNVKVSDKINSPDVIKIASNNYTNVLKSVHEKLEDYVGQQISFSGYVYRVSDFDKNQFVLARDMVASSSSETVVVGFFCQSKNANKFKDGDWVELVGIIKKGNYHGEIPVIEVKDIKLVEKPKDDLVYPPDDSYVQTSIISYLK